jgi:hypothetical protein
VHSGEVEHVVDKGTVDGCVGGRGGEACMVICLRDGRVGWFAERMVVCGRGAGAR